MDKTFEKQLGKLQSLFTQRHAHLIYGLVRWLRPQYCVEVGSYRGYITSVIAKALDDEGQGVLFAIDNFSLHGNSADFLHNILVEFNVAQHVYIMNGDSKQEHLWPGQVDFAFIDGNHSFEYAQTDFINAAKRGAKCIVIHDTVSWWGPRMLVETKIEGYNFIECVFDGGLGIYLKIEQKDQMTHTQETNPMGVV